jgi:hypothetical protein
MGMNLEILIEPCARFKSVSESFFENVFGCKKCKTSVFQNDKKYCSTCGNIHVNYEKRHEQLIDVWNITDDEMFDHSTEEYTYCFSNISLENDIEFDESKPFIFKEETIKNSIKSFNEKHKENIKKLKKHAPDLEVIFVALKRWV